MLIDWLVCHQKTAITRILQQFVDYTIMLSIQREEVFDGQQPYHTIMDKMISSESFSPYETGRY